MPTYKDIDLLSKKSAVAGTEKLPVSDTEYITPAQITEELDDILDVERGTVSTDTVTPSTNDMVKEYPAIALVAGRTYKFVIHPNGYVPSSSINAALAIHTATGTTDATVVQEVIIVTRAQYTGADIIVYYTPTEDTSHVRFYVGAAQTVGSGVQFVTSYEVSNRLKAIDDILDVGDIAVSTDTVTPSTNDMVKEYPAIALVAGRTYKFVIHPNGYVPSSSINAALAIHTATGTTDATVVQEVIIVTRAQYTGYDVTVYYTPSVNTSHVRFYVGAAQTVGSGVQFVTYYEDSNRLKTIEESIGDVETLLAAI